MLAKYCDYKLCNIYYFFVFQLRQMNQNNFNILRFILLTIIIIKWIACMQYVVPLFLTVFKGKSDPNSWVAMSKVDYEDHLHKYIYVIFRSCGYLLCELCIIHVHCRIH